MRADRLLSLLMLLQTRGRMTAQVLAKELEVSERTIYRDIEALSMAGVPVYADRGPGGGCMLLDNYRTTLTGLTEDEVRALFMVSIPAPLDQLGVSKELRTARLKLTAALPSARQQAEAAARQRIHLDSTWWHSPDESTPCLQLLHEAVWQDQRVECTLRLTLGFFEAELERTIDPFGLVAKANVWYLVGIPDSHPCTTHPRVYRASHVLRARLTGQHFARPVDFDLAAFWKAWCSEAEANRLHYPVTVRIAARLIPLLHKVIPVCADPPDAPTLPDAEGRVTLTLAFENLEDARNQLLGLGGAVEVLEPEMLRRSIVDLATQMLSVYEGKL